MHWLFLLIIPECIMAAVCANHSDINDDIIVRLSFFYKKVGGLVGFYGISTFVGYLTPNPLLCK